MDNKCKFYKYGYCKIKDNCQNNHVKGECSYGSHCKNIKTCSLRHPKMCKRMVLEGICGFGEKCAYNHKRKIDIQSGDNIEMFEELNNLKAEVKKSKVYFQITYAHQG